MHTHCLYFWLQDYTQESGKFELQIAQIDENNLHNCHSLSLCPSSPATFPIPQAPSLPFSIHPPDTISSPSPDCPTHLHPVPTSPSALQLPGRLPDFVLSCTSKTHENATAPGPNTLLITLEIQSSSLC